MQNITLFSYKQQMDITLYSFAQQCTCFLAQGMQHHTKLCLRPLIGAPSLFFDPDLVCILRGVTAHINSIAITSNVTRCMDDAVVLSSGHYWISVSIFIGKNDHTLVKVPKNMQNMVNMQNISHMQNMYILFTQGGKDLDIHLVLRGISSSIQIVPLNQNKSDTNELT